MSKLGMSGQVRSGEVLRGEASQAIKFVVVMEIHQLIDDHFREPKGFSFDGRFRIDQIEIDSVMSKGLETTDRQAVSDQKTLLIRAQSLLLVRYPTMQRSQPTTKTATTTPTGQPCEPRSNANAKPEKIID